MGRLTHKLSPDDKEDVVRRYNAGESSSQIAKHFEVSNVAILGILKRRGVQIRSAKEAHPQGREAGRVYTNQHGVGLSDAVREDVVARYKSGQNSPQIALEIGTTVATVCKILRQHGVATRDPALTATRCVINHSAFDQLTPEACYWLGLFFADGSISEKRSQGKSPSPLLQLSLSGVDSTHVDAFKSFLGSSHAITVRNPSKTGFANGKGCRLFSAASVQLCARVHELGFAKSARKASPELANSRDFWRGFVDGDGFIGTYNGYPAVGVHKQLEIVTQFRDFVRQYCPDSDANVVPHKSIFSYRISCRYAIKIIDVLYSNACQALPRKLAIANAILRGEPLPDSHDQDEEQEQFGVTDSEAAAIFAEPPEPTE